MSLLDSCNDADQNVLRRLAVERPDLADAIHAPYTTPFWKTFGGVERSRVQCHVCSASSDTDMFFNSLQITIPPDESHPSVESALRFHLNPEELDRPCTCVAVGRRSKSLSVIQWPSVLLIGLKRFHTEGYLASYRVRKLSMHVSFHSTLRVDEGTQYALRGLVVHSGEFAWGHYIAYVRDAGHLWYIFDDRRAPRVVPFADVASAEAYTFFMRKYEAIYSQCELSLRPQGSK